MWMPTGFSTTLARAPSKARAIHGEIATTVCASAPCTRNSRLAATVLGASCACTMTGTPASRAPMTGATRTVLLTITTSIRCRLTIHASRTASGMERPIWSAHRPYDAPQIGRDVGPWTIEVATSANAPRSGPAPTAITKSHS